MMKPENLHILVINGGSSSIRFAWYEMLDHPVKILSGQIKRIGLKNPSFSFTRNSPDTVHEIHIDSKDFKEAAEFLIHWLNDQNCLNTINCIGHRIVHGMEHAHPEMIDDRLLKVLNEISDYDPDHLPAEIEIIHLFKKHLPNLVQVACFDTSFHTTMPRVAKILAIPRRFDQAGVRRYGFHGLSFAYLMEALKKLNGTKPGDRIILAHLGNGASLAAVQDGRSLDTTMGFTPAGGLVMGTRPGDIDPGVAWYIMKSEKLTPIPFNHLINHESGLLGVSEISSDMLDLLREEDSDTRAAEAIDLFCYQAKKWIGAYTAVLNGLDILVFSGGIGENAPVIRWRICENLNYLGIEINKKENDENAILISTEKSKVKVFVIPTDEEITIAKHARELYVNIQNNLQ